MIRAALSRCLAPIAAAGSPGGLKRIAAEAAVCTGILRLFASFACAGAGGESAFGFGARSGLIRSTPRACPSTFDFLIRPKAPKCLNRGRETLSFFRWL